MLSEEHIDPDGDLQKPVPMAAWLQLYCFHFYPIALFGLAGFLEYCSQSILFFLIQSSLQG